MGYFLCITPALRRLDVVKSVLTVFTSFAIVTGLLEVWCSGLTCSPVKAEIAGSNPVTSAQKQHPVVHRPGVFGFSCRGKFQGA